VIKLDDIPEALAQTVGGGAVLVGLGWLGRAVFRAMSKVKLELASDRADGNQVKRIDAATAASIERLEREVARQILRADHEAERADQAYRERNEAIQRAAEAVSEIGALRRHVEYLENEVASLKAILQAIYDGKPVDWAWPKKPP